MFESKTDLLFVAGEGPQIDPDTVRLVPKAAAYEARLLPLKVENRKLICLGYEPLDLNQVSAFQSAICREVSVKIGDKKAVMDGLLAAYGPDRDESYEEIVEAVTQTRSKFKPSEEASQVPRLTTGDVRVIAVTSGKGGVGKSSVTTNLALTLARRGYKVGVIDCDFGLSNMHVMLGAKPKFNLSDVVSQRVDIRDAFELVAGGFYLLAGAPGAAEFANLTYSALQDAGAGFSALANEFDFLFLDTAAGVHEGVVSLLLASDSTLLVMTPEPASVLDGFVTAQTLLQRNPGATIQCVINQAESDSDAKLIYAKFKTFLGLNGGGQTEFVGKIQADKAAKLATKNRAPYSLAAPHCQAAKDVDAVACRLAKLPIPVSANAGIFERLFGKIKAA